MFSVHHRPNNQISIQESFDRKTQIDGRIMETVIHYSGEATMDSAIQKLWQHIDHSCHSVWGALCQRLFVMENAEVLVKKTSTEILLEVSGQKVWSEEDNVTFEITV